MNEFENLGFCPADILLPDVSDMTKWGVVACDQYTSEPEYWIKADRLVGGAPSALRLMLPEVWLEKGDTEKRINEINGAMADYLNRGIFKEYKNSLIYCERTQRNGAVRKGLVGAVDLEAYDFKADAKPLIRATEGTVLERIPPRVKMRENALLEMPHVMLLIDDPNCTVIEPLADLTDAEVVYDCDLMCDSGHITGRTVTQKGVSGVARALRALGQKEQFNTRYGLSGQPVMLYAVGDGNHSLASAKTCWENIKKTLEDGQKQNHPARYALVELVNLHDPSLEFEPIHRVVFDADPNKLLEDFAAFYPETKKSDCCHEFTYICGVKSGKLAVHNPQCGIAAGTIQVFLDGWIKKNGGRIDYIHGDDVVVSLAVEKNTIGFLLPPVDKGSLFKTVIDDGALPRKSFSMGEAHDKRFYFECRKITV